MSFYKRIKERIAKRVITRENIKELKVGDMVNYHADPEREPVSTSHKVINLVVVEGAETVVYISGHDGPVLLSHLSQSGPWIDN